MISYIMLFYVAFLMDEIDEKDDTSHCLFTDIGIFSDYVVRDIYLHVLLH